MNTLRSGALTIHVSQSLVLMLFLALHALVLKVITILCNPLLARSHALVFRCFMCYYGVFGRKLSISDRNNN